MARISRKRRRFNVGLECYTPTVATAINSKASPAVREHRNARVCPLHLDPAIVCGELETARTGGVRTEILKGCNPLDFVRHDGEFD